MDSEQYANKLLSLRPPPPKPTPAIDPDEYAAYLTRIREEIRAEAANKITNLKREARIEYLKTHLIETMFPDTGALRRELYPKHLEFFAAGKDHRERTFVAGNRVGKTIAGGYEMTCHLTGEYPVWWEGKRFDKPITAWCAGDTSKTTRDIIQNKLLGTNGNHGTGLIPKDKIVRTLQKVGIPEAVEIIYIKHKSGKNSICIMKSFDQRREAFQGTECDIIWLDEEPPQEIYVECLLRTMTTNGSVYITFTPLMGLSDVVLSFCPNGEMTEGELKDAPSKYLVCCDWDSIPHLTQKDKDELLASIPPFQRDARSKGIPQLGSGAIYQVPESEIIVDDFEIPNHWRRVYGMDVGWNRTAVVWGAINPDTNNVYLYSEHYVGRQEPIIHASAVNSRGEWIPGVIDPAARGRGQSDGHALFDSYIELGLKITAADNTREAGIYKVWEMLVAGKLKVFKSLTNFRSEYRVYRRDEKGNIVKTNDHLMDATRYLCVTGLDIAICKPPEKTSRAPSNISSTQGWMS